MEGNTNSSTNIPGGVPPVATPMPAPVIPTKKKHTPVIIASVILLVLAIAGAGFAIWYFTQPKTTPGTTYPTASESGITDEDTKLILQSIISNMFKASSDDAELVIKDINYPDVDLFKNGQIAFEDAITTTVESLGEESFTPLTPELAPRIQAILTEKGYTEIDTNNIKTVKAETVLERYKDIYGSTFDKASVTTGRYLYDPENDIFFNVSGVNPPENTLVRYYYVSRFTEDGDKKYAYTSGALYDTEKGIVYCDVFNPYLAEDNLPSECATNVDGNFFLDEENYKDYAASRFEFEKTSDDTYSFTGVIPVDL